MSDKFDTPPRNLKALFEFYDQRVKPLYAEIEARNNSLPIELPLEIYAAFDHLKRYFAGSLSEAEVIPPAFSHLKRGALDAFKLKLKYYNTAYDAFQKNSTLFPIIDNGDFLREVQRNRQAIIKAAQRARLNESNQDIDLSFQDWLDASALIDKFYDEFQTSEKLTWAKAYSAKLRWKDRLTSGVVGGVIGIIIGSAFNLAVGAFKKYFMGQ